MLNQPQRCVVGTALQNQQANGIIEMHRLWGTISDQLVAEAYFSALSIIHAGTNIRWCTFDLGVANEINTTPTRISVRNPVLKYITKPFSLT
jgi:hypothetical protein